MKRTVFIYGLLAGIVSICLLPLYFLFTGKHDAESMGMSMYLGYTCIILSTILICFGIASYKKNKLGGTISYGRAVAVGLLTALVASTVYVGIWMAMYRPFFSDFGKQYAAVMTETMRKEGKDEKEITKMQDQMKLYDENAVYRAAFTYLEPLTVQIPIVLIASIFIARRKKRQSAI